jgi:hypothetical protein
MLHSCNGMFPWKEDGIPVLAGLAPSSQIVGSLLRTHSPAQRAGKIQHKVSLANSLQFKYILNCSTFNTFREVKNSTNISTIIEALAAKISESVCHCKVF